MSTLTLLARVGIGALLFLAACDVATQTEPGASASPPSFSWASEDTTTNDVAEMFTAVDAKGNVVTGTTRATAASGYTAHVRRYDAAKNLVFDVQLAQTGVYIRGVLAANDGSTYAFIDGASEATGDRLVKLDASGQAVWVVAPSAGRSILAVRELTNGSLAVVVEAPLGKTPYATQLSPADGTKTVPLFSIPLPYATAVGIDADGTMAFAGPFTSPIAATSLSPAGNSDTYVAKVDASGHVLWTISEGGDLDVRVMALAFLPDGSLVGAGAVASAGYGETDGQAFGADLGADYPFLVGFSSTGAVAWLTHTTDEDGLIMAATLSIGPHSIFFGVRPEQRPITNAIYATTFDGQPLWGMPVNMDVHSVAIAPDGSFYAAGVITGVLAAGLQGNEQAVVAMWK